jgi:hypothetical protein
MKHDLSKLAFWYCCFCFQIGCFPKGKNAREDFERMIEIHKHDPKAIAYHCSKSVAGLCLAEGINGLEKISQAEENRVITDEEMDD